MEGTVPVEFPGAVWNAAIAEIGDFDEVVRLYRPRIFRYLMATLNDRDAAESLTQDCFFKAWNARHQFRGESSLMTWLTRIAVNLARDYIRNRRMRFWQKTRSEALDPMDIGDWLPDERSTPEQAFMAREKVNAVWSVVQQLSPHQRTVFLLRFVEEMELPQIAQATGMNENTVKSHLYRALRTVRERVGRKS
jgi:RNA polymerase sigma-70 factor, ECF subfamily